MSFAIATCNGQVYCWHLCDGQAPQESHPQELQTLWQKVLQREEEILCGMWIRDLCSASALLMGYQELEPFATHKIEAFTPI